MLTTIKRWSGWESLFVSTMFFSLFFFLARRDDILVLKDIHYITGWDFVFLSALEYLSFSKPFSCVFVTNVTMGIIGGFANVLFIRLDGQSPTGGFCRKDYKRTER